MLNAALFVQAPLAPGHSEKLIRLLMQSPCVPFLSDKRVELEEETGFFIKLEPSGFRVGNQYAEGPAGIVLLRYATEWHIWRDRIPLDVSPSICDLAAAKTAGLFLSFLEQQAQVAAQSCLPAEFFDALSWAKDTVITPGGCDLSHLTYLVALHDTPAQVESLSAEWLDVVDTLAAPTEYHFTQGGDARLLIDDESRLNMYGCQPFPRNDAYTFASSTATSVSSHAYSESEKYRQQLIEDCLHARALEPLARHSAHIKQKIVDTLELSDLGCSVMIAPSGTDAQLYTVALVAGATEQPSVSIVAAADETGSGTPNSVTGRHFNEVTDLGVTVCRGDALAGMPDIAYQGIPLRDENGLLATTDEMDKAVRQAVGNEVERGRKVLLHVMDQSKLGCGAPSLEMVDRIASTFGDSVQIVVDACQVRIDSPDIRRYLTKGYVVLVTGSKFFTGPPFSGAVLFPEPLARRIGDPDANFARGLGDYLPAADIGDWPPALSTPRFHNGIGMYLRWWAALAEIERYNDVPEGLRRLGLDCFCRAAEQILGEADFIELVFGPGDGQYTKPEVIGAELSCRRTILPFRILCDGRYLDADETRQVYNLLNRDISDLVTGTANELRLAGRGCHIGQPVKVACEGGASSAVLRVSAGARILSESWLHKDVGMFFKKIGDEADQIEFIVQKIGLILKKELYQSRMR